MFKYIEGRENPVELTRDGKITFELKSGLVVEAGRDAKRLFMRRSVKSIEDDITAQTARMGSFQKIEAQTAAAGILELFAKGSEARAVTTKALTGTGLLGLGILAVVTLSNPVGQAALVASMAIAGGRIALEKNRAKKFERASAKFTAEASIGLTTMPRRRAPAPRRAYV